MNVIKEFKGENHFLSNFHIAQQKASYNGRIITYQSNEHFFQANKANNWEQHLAIANAPAPWIAKRMGSKKGYKDFKVILRPDWEDIKINIMRIGLNCKFRQNPHLAKLLIATNPARLEEGNWWYDDFWGICLRKEIGSNWLGILLMELRNNLILGLSPLDQPTLYS